MHETNIAAELIANGHSLQVGQLLPNSIVVTSPVTLPPCRAMLTVTVAGVPLVQRVWLPDGVAEGESEVRMELYFV